MKIHLTLCDNCGTFSWRIRPLDKCPACGHTKAFLVRLGHSEMRRRRHEMGRPKRESGQPS